MSSRWYIFGKDSTSIFTINRNTMESADEQCLVQPLDVEEEICFTQNLLQNVTDNEHIPDIDINIPDIPFSQDSFIEPEYDDCSQHICDEISEQYEDLLTTFEMFQFREAMHSEGQKYITGYVAHRFRDKYDLGTPTRQMEKENMPDWIQHISWGSLLYPNDALLNAAKVMEEIFHDMHGNFLSKEKNIFNLLAEKTLGRLKDELPREVILCLVRTRTYIRLPEINKTISADNRRRRSARKVKKFTNK